MKIIVDSSCDILYSSYYIKGLQDYFGKRNIRFSNKYFDIFKHNNHFFAFVIKEKKELTKIIIDFADRSVIDESALEWSDVYGKINVENSKTNQNKIIPIGPSFGIKIYSPTKTIILAAINFIRSYYRIPNKRRFLSDYKALLNRPTLNDYFPNFNKDGYIYFAASLWKKEIKTNTFRANFIRACKNHHDIKFEGGFAPRVRNDVEGFDELIMKSRDKMNTYINKLKHSSVVFNTPAVTDCHGWKLAEFLCSGKVIISTPISRILPQNLIDNKHIMFTSGSEQDITKKLEKIISSKKISDTLKKNAREYFETELSPEKVIKRIIDKK
ncbi:glycosyltransferase [Ancylomarina sp. YFZ004]